VKTRGECMGASMGIQWEAVLAAQAWGGGGRWRLWAEDGAASCGRHRLAA
jgi:hypothetical protein